MAIKSKNGASSVHTPTMSSSNSAKIQIVSGKNIVHKPLNTHRQQPGIKGKVGL